jgi:hypothetical protein
MASFTSAGSAWTTTAGNKTVTATPVAGDLIVVIVGTSGVSGGTTAVSDNNSDGKGVYTQIVAAWSGFSTTGRMTMWVRNFLVGSASSTVFTATQAGSTGGGLEVCRISGMTRTGIGAVRGCGGQSSGTAGTTPAPVLLARNGTVFSGTQAALTGNLCLGAVASGSSAPAIIGPASWTESIDLAYLTPATSLETAFRNSGETGSTITWGSGIANAFASMAVELDTSVITFAHGLQALQAVNRSSVW